ncbi:iron chelate uptake ABC transporter family permease subunit [Reinekea marina]|uniref:Iron chelate uptake ABC transporter family permease subunit n=1 Tax=Reinekea marina TaxID=1310421 RepID=A0ABV7WRU8_9GAMM|nr:iron chelate uptake ABC transporter family permease subunit [Reinekea marina]MDN3648185.1 iron chelate uptake ABC transporter family permease subunit [Reinekea marina]
MHNTLQTNRSMLQSPVVRVSILLALLAIAFALYLTWDMKASLEFTLKYRSKKLITLVIVGAAISISTVLFQTMTENRILTPGIMGFDSLYGLIQALLVVSLGVIGFNTLNPYLKWLLETSAMVACTALLYRIFFKGNQQSLQFLLLAGIVLGILFGSASGLIFRMLDPTEFTVLQDNLFASFSRIDSTMLVISICVITFSSIYIWRKHATLDVMLLGRHCATNLGINIPRMTKEILMIVTVLISVSTALVGPITFFGLLVAHLAYRLTPCYHHRWLLPMAALLGIAILVVGDFLLQHVFDFSMQLSIIIELFGGLCFLALIMYREKT